MNPVAVLYGWFKDHEEYLVSHCGDLEFKDTGRDSACINIGTTEHVISLTAWNHALCLDIQILEVKSEESSFPHTGECKSIEEFKENLNKFYLWLENQGPKNA